MNYRQYNQALIAEGAATIYSKLYVTVATFKATYGFEYDTQNKDTNKKILPILDNLLRNTLEYCPTAYKNEDLALLLKHLVDGFVASDDRLLIELCLLGNSIITIYIDYNTILMFNGSN